MKDRKLASRYARALLSTLSDAQQAERAEEFLAALATAIDGSRDLHDVLLNPSVPRSARTAVLVALAETHGAPELVASFLRVVVENGRAGYLPDIAEAFAEARAEQAGIVAVTIETASPLSDALKQKTQATLEKLTGHKVQMRFGVDPAHVGGAIAQIGSKVYDGSLRTQLDLLRRRMAAE
jgi:F-type H+-transporting ATPase subunit delta